MKNILLNLTIISLVICFSACKKEEDKDPEIKTVSVTAEGREVKAVGEVIERGSFDILDHGFIYSSDESAFSYGSKVSLGKNLSGNTFTTSFIYSELYYQDDFYVRAYLQNTKGTVYGSSIKFTPARVSVSNVQPSIAKTGDTIVINGTNFYSGDNISVKFNNTDATIINANSNQISVRVPYGILDDSYWSSTITIYVFINGMQSFQLPFSLLPTVTSFSPDHGTFNTKVTITGTDLYNASVYLGEVNVYTSYNSSGSLSFYIPGDISSVKSKIKIIKNGIEILAQGEFIMDSMKVTSVNPSKGVEGANITINGFNFNPYYGNNIVYIGGIPAYADYGSTSTKLEVTVPEGLTEGDHDIQIDNGLYLFDFPGQFHIVTPEISDFQPKSGGYGTLVTFTGENLFFPNGSFSVYFGNSYATIQSYDSAKIKAYIPWVGGIDSIVNIKISKGNEIFFTDSFTVTRPKITGFSPSTGSPGTIVTLTGEGFLTDSWYVSAKFGTISAPVVDRSSTTVKVQVPSDAPAGPMKISLIFYSNTTITTDTDFTVIK